MKVSRQEQLRSRGIFVVLEGIDCVGKSTVLKELVKQLDKKFQENRFWSGYQGYVTTFEPGGGSKVSLAIRDLILKPTDQKRLNNLTEALLFAASRNENVINVIKPNLFAKKIVISDRFVDSSYVYQGLEKKLGYDLVNQINQLVIKDLQIDLTFYLYIQDSVWQERMKQRSQSHNFNVLDSINFQKIKNDYQTVYQLEEVKNRKIIAIKNDSKIDTVVEEIIKHISEFEIN
ncbi:dTMP kinase [[Mycoplasma] cavipharyngis]|uniref:dTMP kinase n=1 Tax=[Mycoplasma] cavipharyngis TaxID=92757 RepID=UPI00370422F2